MVVEAGIPEGTKALIEAALVEDGARRDWTTLWTVEEDARTRARIRAREPLVVAGTEVVRMVFAALDPRVKVEALLGDGSRVEDGAVVLRLEGPARSILAGERTALNFLGRLSGIATLTRRFVEAVEGTGARITDTRKTTPGWRVLEKAAVRVGGGTNHRMGLHDMILVKENHLAAAGGISAALQRIFAANRDGLAVEVEVERLSQLDELEGEPVDRILLDNMDLDDLETAVGKVRLWPEPRPELEASGRMGLERVRRVASAGVQWISVGALTHSAPIADLSLLVDR